MSFKSVLDTIGGDAKKVFAFLGSQPGQAVISTGEAVVEAVDPALTGLITLFNTYLTEALKVQTIATAAGAQTGLGVQKLTAVVTAVTPTVLAYAKTAGLATPTAEEIQNQANAAVAFVNAVNGTPAA
jgi:hypothetical protein